MERAEPGSVVEAGGSAVAAEDDVVQLRDRVGAVGEGAAAAVAEVGGAADGGGELVVGLADVEDFTRAAEHDRDEFSVAGEAARGFGREGGATGQGHERVADPLLEG